MATESPFPEKEYQDRYRRAQALMERDGLDALVVSEKTTTGTSPASSVTSWITFSGPRSAFYRRMASPPCWSMAMIKPRPRRFPGSAASPPIRMSPFPRK